jgi:hypothetical protein
MGRLQLRSRLVAGECCGVTFDSSL